MAENNDFNNPEFQEQFYYASDMKLRDLEEKQRLLKDRILLIGENLIGAREETSAEITKLKSDITKIKDEIEKIKDILQRLSEELDGKARKEDVAILQRQAKMFQPLDLATIHDVEEIIKKFKKKKK